MAIRPDPTFYPSPKLAMEGPPEEFAYTALLSGDSSKPDALAVIDVKRGSPTYSQVVHTVTMPYKGDEFHHFGWNACSSALSPLTGHAFLERRYLIIPGIRSSRVYVVDTKPHPTQAKIHKIIEPEEIFKKTGYSRPHTVHCGPEGIYVSTLGGGGKDGTEGAPGVFIMDCETFEVLGRWEIDRGPQKLHYDFWWNLPRDYMVSSEWGLPPQFENGIVAEDLLANKYGHHLHFWDLRARRNVQTIDLGANPRSKSARRMIRCANMAFWASWSTRPIWKARFGLGGERTANSMSRRPRQSRPNRRLKSNCRPCCRASAPCRR